MPPKPKSSYSQTNKYDYLDGLQILFESIMENEDFESLSFSETSLGNIFLEESLTDEFFGF